MRKVMNRLFLSALVLVVLGATLMISIKASAQAEESAADLVANAWKQAQLLGTYRFRSDVEQITYPAASLRNVGRAPSYTYLTATGETNAKADRIEMSLYSGSTPEENAASRMDVRIEQGQGYVRQPNGEWQHSNDLSNLLFPNGDPLAFIRTLRNVRPATAAEQEPFATSDVTSTGRHFTFELDSASFARYSQQQLEAALRARGELPPGVQLQANDYQHQMAGSGDIWLDSDGLPMHMVMELAFPPAENGDQIAATIRSNFSGFDREALTPVTTALGHTALALHLPRTTQAWGNLAGGMVLFAIFAGSAGMLVLFRRSRKLYATVATSLILATVITPLLQSHKLYAFSEKLEQMATVNSSESVADPMESKSNLDQLLATARGENEMAAQSALEASLQNALNAPTLQTNNNTGADSDGDGLSDSYEAKLGSNPNNVDSDGDTLNDGAEVLKLGTSAVISDTDSDGLNDPKEVAGFLVNGAPWYTSPTDEDSDNDGMLDGADCVGQTAAVTTAAPCADTDGDLTPDIFDADNDGDLVPDSVDLSPFAQRGRSTPYGKDSPFRLSATGLNGSKPLYVNLQLRPKTAAHLASAMNVLDWPARDSQGNIQRFLDTTFANSNNASIRNSDANAGNGDIRIIPMISVRVPKQVGSFGNLPVKAGAAPLTASSTITDFENALDQSKLDAYGMSVLKADNNSLEILAPAMLETDPNGGARVAFNTHMLYQSSANGLWGADHEVRLIWIVQMIIDVCNDPSKAGEAFCDNLANRHDELTVLHTYVDDFYVTGVTIEEQHGMEIGVVYENPLTDSDVNTDNRLWHLGYGLMNIFTNGVDENRDGRRDLTVAEIQRRWSLTSTANLSDTWQIPNGLTAVERFRYDHPDAVASIMMTETMRILNTKFMNGSAPRAASPTLLFARERWQRSSSLDPITSSSVISLGGAPVNVFADVSWAPYRFVNGHWENYAITDYMEQLQTQLLLDPYFIPVDSSTDAQIEAHNRLTAAATLYLSLYQGYSSMVQSDVTLLTSQVLTPQAILSGHPSTTVGHAIHHLVQGLTPGLQELYTFVREKVVIKNNKLASKSAAGLFTALSAVSLIYLYSKQGKKSAYTRVSFAVVELIGIHATYHHAKHMAHLFSAYRSALAGGNAAQAASKLGAFAKDIKMGPIGLAIGVAVAWGMYAYGVLGEGRSADDPGLLAQATATTIFMVLMFIIGQIPVVGAAIQLFIMLFDGLAFLICGVAAISGKLCGGLSGLIIDALATLFYDVTMYVDMEDGNRLRIREVRPEIVDTSMGVIDGNTLKLTVSFTNALKTADEFSHTDSRGTYLLNERHVRKSTFAHTLTIHQENLDANLELGQMSNAWTADWNLERYTRVTELSQLFPLGLYGTGVNVPYVAYLNEGYVVPYQECVIIIFVPMCKTREIRGSSSFNIAEGIFYDILPDTFDEFAAIRFDGTAYRSAWATGGGDFPQFVDADGDGLRSKHVGGSDPDDGKWDTDGDTLSDLFEQGWGSRADAQDSDGDGLRDDQELRYGTNPNRVDSDFDGLNDKAELEGWEFVYGFNGTTPLRTWVRANPVEADPDGDDILDDQERRYGFHPVVASENVVMSYDATLNNPSLPGDANVTGFYARGGQVLNYDARIGNELNNRHIYGQLLTQGDSAFALNGDPQSFFLLPTERVTRTTPITVQVAAPSGIYRVSQRARGYVDDPRTPTQQAVAYWSFDNERPLLDLSGVLPSDNFYCGTAQCPSVTNAGKIGNGIRYDNGKVVWAPNLVSKINSSAYSIGGWVMPQGGGRFTFFAFGAYNGSNLHSVVFDTNTQKFSYVDPTVTAVSTRNFEIDRWYHVMLTIDNGSTNNGRLYVNGMLEATFSTASRPSVYDAFYLGHTFVNGSGRDLWYGTLDEIKVFNRVLTANEVVESMEVIEPAMDANWDNWKSSGGSTNDRRYFDRNGIKEVVNCNGSNCPSIVETPWGSGVTNGQLFLDLSPFTNLKHNRYAIAMWLKPTNTPSGTWHDFISWLNPGSYGNNDVPAVGFDSQGRLHAYFDFNVVGTNNELITSPNTVRYGVWNHVIVSYDGTTLTLYVNGQSVGSTTAYAGNLPDPAGAHEMQLDMLNGTSVVDEVQLYDYVLTSNQAKRIFSGELYKDIHLRFEDAPSANRFANDANRGMDVFCDMAANKCPISNVAGRNGAAVQFQDNSRVLTVSKSTTSAPMVHTTVAAWVKGSGTILSRANDLDLVFSNSGIQIRAVKTSGSTPVTTTRTLSIPLAQQPNPTTWNHIAATFSGVEGGIYVNGVFQPYAQMHLYVNGQEVAADLNGPVGQLLASNSNWQVGSGAAGSGFVGSLDDVRLYRTVLTSVEVQSLYKTSAPSLWLKLDESEGATSFVESTGNYSSATCTSCPKAGQKGRMGASTAFSSTSSSAGQSLQVAMDNRISFRGDQPLSIGAWVKPARQNSTASIVEHRATSHIFTITLPIATFQLSLSNGQPRASFASLTAQFSQTLLTDVWYHLFATYKDRTLTLYVNGEAVSTVSGGLLRSYNSSDWIVVGSGINSNYLDGSVDEVVLFEQALDAASIRQIYEDQSAWVEERSRFEVTVDNDVPTTTIRSNVIYRLNQPAILDVYANDPTSPLYKVELLTNGTAQNAPLCVGSDISSAYCPTFTPTGEGRYQLQSRATDIVGNSSTSALLNVLVDASAPTATLTTDLSAVLRPTAHPSELQRWILPLAGTVSDPNLSSGDAGSGLQSLQLTIYDAAGEIMGTGTQPVSVTVNGAWQHIYLFFEKPEGQYRIEATTLDKTGNQRSFTLGTVTFDGTSPNLDMTSILPSYVISDPISIEGVVTDTRSFVNSVEIAYVPSPIGSVRLNQKAQPGLVMHLPLDDSDGVTTTHDISGLKHDGTCINCPRFEVGGHAGNAAAFDGVDDFVSVDSAGAAVAGNAFSMGAFVYEKSGSVASNAILAFNTPSGGNLNQLHYFPTTRLFAYYDEALGFLYSSDTFAADQWHHLFLTVDAGNRGVVYVNGSPQITFTTAMRPAAISPFSIGQEWDGGTPTDFMPGKIDEVQLYNRALSPTEVRQLMRGSDPVLSLDFEEKWVTNGMTLTDHSGWQHPARVSTNDVLNKSTIGNVGNQAMWFDGMNDVVTVGSHPALDLSNGQFTEAIWIKPEGNDNGFHFIMGYEPIIDNLARRYPGLYLVNQSKIHYVFGNGTQSVGGITPSVLTQGVWSFVTATYDGSAYRIYVNGQLVHTDSSMAGQKPYPSNQLRIGAQENAFRGSLDEVRIYPRALSADEIGDLYRQGWQKVPMSTPASLVVWSTTVPTDTEGIYSIEMRTSDVLGNVSSRQSLWRGVIDNVAPRIISKSKSAPSLSEQKGVASASAAFTLDEYTAQDFNLSTENFSTKCGAGTIDQETDFESDWLLAFTDEEIGNSSRLYEASVSCPQGTELGDVNACDVYGNCLINPQLPEIVISNQLISEDSTSATLMVALTQAGAHDVHVDYWTSDGSAHAPDDYTAITTQTLVIPAGEYVRSIVVPIVKDTIFEPSESFTVALGNPVNATLAQSSGTVTILDNENLPLPFTENQSVDEGVGNAVITITLETISAFDTTILYATSAGSAESPVDYSETSGSATVAAGSSTFTLSVPIVDDLLDELDESFTISLTNQMSGTITGMVAFVTILDNDLAATATPTATATPMETATPTYTPTATETPDPTATATVTPVDTPTAIATDTPQPTATATQSASATATPVATATPLPSLLLDLSVNKEEDGVVISWTVDDAVLATLNHLSHFEVMRQDEQQAQNSLGNVPVNRVTRSLYRIVDTTAQPGVNYTYRLVLVFDSGERATLGEQHFVDTGVQSIYLPLVSR